MLFPRNNKISLLWGRKKKIFSYNVNLPLGLLFASNKCLRALLLFLIFRNRFVLEEKGDKELSFSSQTIKLHTLNMYRGGIPRWRLEVGSRKRASYSEILERCWRHTLQA
jgi:hypothetical protein